MYEILEDTKGIIRSRKSKKDRQHNEQATIDNTVHKGIHIRQHDPTTKQWLTQAILNCKQCFAPLV